MTLDEIIETLLARRRRFGRGPARERLRLLGRAAKLPIAPARTLRAYHDLLLFLVAYPDDRAVRDRAVAELRRCAVAARDMGRLDDSGIANTSLSCTYSIETLTWLAERFGRAVAIDWEDGALGGALDRFLPVLVHRVEHDGTLDRSLSTRDWIRAARGPGGGSDLGWLLSRLERLGVGDAVRDHLVEPLDLRVRWRLSGRRSSRTFLRFPARPTAYQDGPLDRAVTLAEVIDEPLPRVRPLPVDEARDLIDTARATLAIRHRETDPVTHANPREVYLLRLERGLDVAIFGMLPERRLPIESFFGYLAAKNRVPLAYGGGWVFLDRCEIGINIFDELRGGESAWTFAQLCRVYRQLFSARRFTVDPFQFGEDNPDAIRSGAFWFYHRFGFRPTEPAACAIAERESARIQSDAAYRTPRATLRRLAESPLGLLVDEGDPGEPPPDLPALGMVVTRWIGRKFDGDREAAAAFAARRMRTALGVRGDERWSAPERQAFERLSLLVAMVPDLPGWSARSKRDAVALMRAKGGARERVYAARLRRHAELRAAMDRMATRRPRSPSARGRSGRD